MTNIRMYVAAIQKTEGDLIQFCSPESDRFLETLEGHLKEAIATKNLDRLALHLVDSFDNLMTPLKLSYDYRGRLQLEEDISEEIRVSPDELNQYQNRWDEIKGSLPPDTYQELKIVIQQALGSAGFRL